MKNSLAQTSTISANGYIMVKIIQMSIILMYDVVGRLWLMPMKLAGKIQLVSVYKLVNVIASSCSFNSTYKVARTSITVRLTWTTMVRNWSVNMLISWLRNISIPVGRVTW